MVVSSAPSSAYYSDLSVTAMPGGGASSNERAYEIVGLTVMSQPLPNWEASGCSSSSTLSMGTAVATGNGSNSGCHLSGSGMNSNGVSGSGGINSGGNSNLLGGSHQFQGVTGVMGGGGGGGGGLNAEVVSVQQRRAGATRLAAINETSNCNVPSDYV